MNRDSGSIAHLHILLAEDDAMSRKVTLLMLRRLGYKADAVKNGLEVLKFLETNPYDLVLMDIVMPEMDGFEATREIRRHWHDWPKIVAFTAYLLPDLRERCVEAGMDDYLVKPVHLDDLHEMLRRFEIALTVKN
jgi:CheY-like chemotaxis protein